jgi:hypothetical protein
VALHKARRSLAFAANHRDGLRIQLIARSALLVLRKWIKRRTVIFGDFVDIVRRAAGFQNDTTRSTSSSDTNGPWTRVMRPPPAM